MTVPHDYALRARVSFRMVELGAPPAKRYPQQMPAHDLPSAISKLRPTSTLLKPREGPTPGWIASFDDLLSIHSLSDYKHQAPPVISTFRLWHEDEANAQSAFSEAWAEYRHYNTLLYHLLTMCVDLSGPFQVIDTKYIADVICLGDHRDGRAFYKWCTSFKPTSSLESQSELHRRVYRADKIPVNITIEQLSVHLTNFARDWRGITANTDDAPETFWFTLLETLPDKPETSKVAVLRTWLATKVAELDPRLRDIDSSIELIVSSARANKSSSVAFA